MTTRQSLYPSTGPAFSAPSHQVLNHLSSCISSVDLTCRTLESINDHLQEQTSDFQRFSSVLASKKHFDLVSEKEIQEAKAHLSAEITPQLKQLILRAEEALQRDERKSKTLKAKAGQQSLRLEQLAQRHDIPLQNLTTDTVDAPSPPTASTDVDQLRKELLNLRRERQDKQSEMDLLEKEIQREREALARGR